ncbi:hypothetical protein Celal_3119 [Cellulophaga algicola DSM 14237]|uniref:Lipolytic protein G-D-S-L family n=1 Tax=Cellulophaga algicola (strain DSM 14237 / IC166 / ACAM 630) TaxID=688270 RepID=E6X451_CELAD|nr:hypothetical protein [Cellulophaga algicola]ADV50393.1 hypothetical protein Celal_3119 [Cellulophaga algicola DSM 14237]
MGKIIKKIVIYSILVLLLLEGLVRIFHLHNEVPRRFADDKGVEKWVPNQSDYSITGNRKQNVGHYRINDFGFNSVHENYQPKSDAFEIALVGDSFIEGFHEDYINSLGQQIEKSLTNTTVLEFGYAGYDLADELNLIHAYKDLFDKIDYTFIYLRFTDDLDRGAYEESSRLSLDTPISRVAKQVKLLVYLKDIGALDPLLQLPGRIKGFISGTKESIPTDAEVAAQEKLKQEQSLENFKKLVATYPIDKEKFTFLLDSSLCSPEYLSFLKEQNYTYLDINTVLSTSKEATTLVYDQHWSKHGRKLIADLVSKSMLAPTSSYAHFRNLK